MVNIETWTLNAWNGESYLLETGGNENTDGYHLLKGVTGHMGLEKELPSDKVPGMPGEEIYDYYVRKREIAMPIKVVGSTPADKHAKLVLLRRATNAKYDAELSIVNAEGQVRTITGRFLEGFSGAAEGFSDSGPTVQKVMYRFEAAEDPYFYPAPAYNLTYSKTFTPDTNPFLGDTPYFFHDGWLGISSLYDSLTVTNPGEADAWPVWTITGPGKVIQLRNTTSGKSLRLNVTVRANETIVIDTRFGERKTIISTWIDGSGTTITTSLRPFLQQEDRDFWAFVEGDNDVELEMNLATAESTIAYTARPPYEGV